ncbi:hypothetical protein Scep_030109 [Stephania cephalantha]|uniref:Uncharacterized protein n=1 Tax=Stephania cephalantha TaxID=152367 RepID=A0AAP0HCW3_9MAGN
MPPLVDGSAGGVGVDWEAEKAVESDVVGEAEDQGAFDEEVWLDDGQSELGRECDVRVALLVSSSPPSPHRLPLAGTKTTAMSAGKPRSPRGVVSTEP